MKRMAIAFCAVTTLSLVHAAHHNEKNEKKVYASSLEAMKDNGLLRQLPDGSWTADQPIRNIHSRSVGFTLTADGQWQPGGTTVTIDACDSQQTAYQRQEEYAYYMQQHHQTLEQGKRMREDAAEERKKLEQERMLAAQERIKAQQERDELARQRAAEARQREEYRRNASQSSSSSASTQYTTYASSNQIYVAGSYVTLKNRIMAHEHDLGPNEFCNGSYTHKTLAEVKAMYDIKD